MIDALIKNFKNKLFNFKNPKIATNNPTINLSLYLAEKRPPNCDACGCDCSIFVIELSEGKFFLNDCPILKEITHKDQSWEEIRSKLNSSKTTTIQLDGGGG